MGPCSHSVAAASADKWRRTEIHFRRLVRLVKKVGDETTSVFLTARPTPFSEGFFLPTLARWRWRPNQNTLLRTVTHLETRSQRPLQRCRTLQIHFLVFLFQFFSPPQKKICIKVDSFPWNSIFFHKIKIRTAETIFISNRNV